MAFLIRSIPGILYRKVPWHVPGSSRITLSSSRSVPYKRIPQEVRQGGVVPCPRRAPHDPSQSSVTVAGPWRWQPFPLSLHLMPSLRQVTERLQFIEQLEIKVIEIKLIPDHSSRESFEYHPIIFNHFKILQTWSIKKYYSACFRTYWNRTYQNVNKISTEFADKFFQDISNLKM